MFILQFLQVASEAWLKKGDPTEVICLEVKRIQPDFLVVGSRGLGPFKKYALVLLVLLHY